MLSYYYCVLFLQEWLDMVVGRIISSGSPPPDDTLGGTIRRAQESWAQVMIKHKIESNGGQIVAMCCLKLNRALMMIDEFKTHSRY